MITVTVLMTKGIFDSSMKTHITNAKKNGVTAEEMAELITHAAFYAGWPTHGPPSPGKRSLRGGSINGQTVYCVPDVHIAGRKNHRSYMDTPEAENSFEEYERANQFYQPQAWINGRVTVDENFTFYEKPDLAAEAAPIPHEDHVALAGQETIWWPPIHPVGLDGNKLCGVCRQAKAM